MCRAADEVDRLSRPDVERHELSQSASKMTQSAPAAPTANAAAIHPVSRCRNNTQPNPAAITGVKVKTAAALTGAAVRSPSNISQK